MSRKFSLDKKKCCYCYISKDLKTAIDKHKRKLQKEENAKRGRKAESVTFVFASKDFIKGGFKKWF